MEDNLSTALVPAPTVKVERPRDPATGKFLTKRDKLSAQKNEQRTRDFLYERDPEDRKRRIDTINQKLYEMVKRGADSDKAISGAVKAAEALLARGFGRVRPSDAELDRLVKHPVSIVIVPAMEGIKPMEERKKPTEPIFADAEIIS